MQDGQNLISWRWSLPLPTDPVWWRSMQTISSYRGNKPTTTHTNTQTHRQTNRQDRLQYTASLSLACSVINRNSLTPSLPKLQAICLSVPCYLTFTVTFSMFILQAANPGSLVRIAVKMECVCVRIYIFIISTSENYWGVNLLTYLLFTNDSYMGANGNQTGRQSAHSAHLPCQWLASWSGICYAHSRRRH